MPVDYKRINGPENTVPYNLFCEKRPQLEIKNGRNDARALLEHRKIFMKTGTITQAKGSAYLEIGNTKVVVSVFDPREIPNKTDYSQKGELYCEFKYATFSCPHRRQHQQDSEEKQNSIILKQALQSSVCLHEFPNFQVDIYALILENDGSAISAAITCASLALSHAGVPMYDLVTAVTLGIIESTFVLDPTLEEERLCDIAVRVDDDEDKEKEFKDHGIIVCAILSTHQQISQFYQTGNVTLENLTKSVDIVTDANKEIVPLMEKMMVKHVLKIANKNEA